MVRVAVNQVDLSRKKNDKERNDVMIAVIPLIVWAIGLMLAGSGGFGAGVYVAVKWKDINGPTTSVVVRRGSDGAVQTFPDPAVCVHWYYQAVCTANHRQYQYCVIEPLDKRDFEEKSNALKVEMEKRGICIVEEPVRGRSQIVEKNGLKGATVFAVSPWTGKEEKYAVVAQGQSWQIIEEK